MIAINLLPWRENKRIKIKGRRIWNIVILVTIFFIVSLIINFKLSTLIQKQLQSNQLLDQEILKISLQTDELNKIRELRDILKNRLKKIYRLLVNTQSTNYLLKELAQLVPTNANLTELKVNNNKVSLLGVADTYSSISNLMNRITANPWMENPTLLEIKQEDSLINGNKFKINFNMKHDNHS